MRTPKINAPFFLIFILFASMAAGILLSIYGLQRPHAPSSLFTEEFRTRAEFGYCPIHKAKCGTFCTPFSRYEEVLSADYVTLTIVSRDSGLLWLTLHSRKGWL